MMRKTDNSKLKNKKLKLRANIGREAMYPNIDALKAGKRRFIGWDLVKVEEGGKVRFGLQFKTEVEEVSYHSDYVRAVKLGDLEAADQETADLCGVQYVGSVITSKSKKENK